jgi:YebC/PmpR family DNA-binding regulatory protein
VGRIFEKRKSTIFARNARMAKIFTRLSREIAIAVRSGTADAATNPALRRVLANARTANMPKDKIDAAIKRASGQDQKSWETIVYEGYAPHGIALMIETATDNPQRTVANVRSIMKDWGGSFGQSGSVAFLFVPMGVFRIEPAGIDQEALELDLIDHGLEEMGESTSDKGEPELVVRCKFGDFGRLQAALEERKVAVVSAESEQVAQTLVSLDDEAKIKEVMDLVAALEGDDDVQRVFHNLA